MISRGGVRYGALMTLSWVVSVSLTACGGEATPPREVGLTATAQAAAQVMNLSAERVAIGKQIFEDPSLSASGKLACASCHIAARAHADASGGFLPLGGPNMDAQGLRSSPTTHYLFANTAFRFVGNEPFGGFTWDGRADSLITQAGGPFFDAAEMANADLSELMGRVRNAGWFADFMSTYQVAMSASDQTIFEAVKTALATYELGDSDYQLFNSKFDRVQEGTATFTEQELRGLAYFNDPAKGNCAACHTSSQGSDGAKPLFTNFGYYALGVPRNLSQRTADPQFFDLGLCGPNRKDLASRSDLCGKFKTPTLRNVELTAPYFHNAAINDLTDAVRFHVSRDTSASRWYPTVSGVVQSYNDLPVQYHGNLTRTAPFDRNASELPALSEDEISDVVAFLKTLTDVIPAQ
ncbi:MAG: hypothetical protein RIR70_229 [Pseudomonadota bacterium]|jgi:cytochrome c peroxidase